MDVFQAISSRRSIRKYKPDKIPETSLIKVLEAARLAPSAGNKQPWRFVVVRDARRRAKLAKAANDQDFVGKATVVIVVFGDPRISGWYNRDPMTATEHMCLEAVELGLGTCWIGAFDEAEVKKILKAPEELSVTCIIPLGYPAESPSARSRRKFPEIFFKEKYGKSYTRVPRAPRHKDRRLIS